MVLGLKNKNRRGPCTQIEYLIHVQEIKPWPPTQSLKNVRSVLIQWENGERNSGSTASVTPSIDDGKIVFNESFRLPVTLSRDMSVKSGGAHVFHKNLLEFSLYEPRRDKTLKGQLLGTAIVDVAEYGIFRETLAVNATINCTRSFGNSVQPILHLKIQAYDRARAGSNVSLRGKLVKETLLDNNDVDSVSALMSEEYADEAEIGSFTDDDVSSHSSHTASSAVESSGASPLHTKEIGSGRVKFHSDLSSIQGKTSKIANTLSDASDMYSELNLEKVSSISGQSQKSTRHISEEVASLISNSEGAKTAEKLNSEHDIQREDTRGSERRLEISERKSSFAVALTVDAELKDSEKRENNELLFLVPAEEKCIVGNASPSKLSSDVMEKRIFSGSDSNFSRDRVRHVKSVRSSTESSRSHGLAVDTMRQESNIADRKSTSSDSKIQGLEQRVKILERELREVAALELALYSVVAEHGCSTNKVHAPARRLSRLYLRPSKEMKRASAAQSVVSGLIVVAKACGNDVPRLTFWLSNCVVLRAIVSESFTEEQQRNDRKGVNQKSFALKWKDPSSDKKANRSFINGKLDYEDPYSFMSALEKVECWIFSRIVESVWWQTLTPHMQASAAQMIDKVVDPGFQKKYRRSSSSGGQEQVNLSLELWQKAFKDACERLCPLRAAGHECGCLTVLSKLIMEQCVARLDVAMFNAILRKSADDIPTDPVSDPISDAKVLPIPAGKSSFGSGAQLKNAIGNWSRWLSDLFGMDDDDPSEDKSDNYMDDGSEGPKLESSFKSFYLLKSLSDLMMLPKDMLMNETVRREVCPTFGTQLIKRVLDMFVPDEFCSEQIPDAVFEALDPESTNGDNEELINYYPITAPAVHYSPPLPSSLEFVVGVNLGTSSTQLRRSGSVLRRSNTSDDELDELDSPLHSIFGDESPAQKRNWKLMQNHQKNIVRYKLLREVWDDEAESWKSIVL